MPYTPLQTREIFHLCFLQEFLRKFEPKFVVLKGGVNLRFFFKSRRYSEDIDLDVRIASVASIQKKVFKTLAAISIPLKVYDVTEIVPPSLKSAKQTETTQRFKIHLKTRQGLDLFTKIDFSCRGNIGEAEFGRVDAALLREYRLAPVVVQHYSAASAFEQKITALAGRTETQARDLFDLHHLLGFLPRDHHHFTLKKDLLKKANDRIGEISFEQYRSSVVAYLEEADQRLMGLEETWEDVKRTVSNKLEKAGTEKDKQ